MKIKICGIRRREDTDYLNEFRPDFAGFILSKPFWRYVPPEDAARLAAALDTGIQKVGVFVNPSLEEIEPYAPFLDVIQLHGEEDAALLEAIRARFGLPIWKAARVRTPEDIQKAEALPADMLVLDSFSPAAHGGTGTVANWELIAKHRPEKPFWLAGGISAENAADAAALSPYGLDASSSVETDRHKDREKIQTLVTTIRHLG